MPPSDHNPTLRALELAAARTSDAAADLLASLTGMGHSIRSARAARSSVAGIGKVLVQGRTGARRRRVQSRILPSIRLADHSAEVIAAAAARGLDNVRVFGSCVHETDTLTSDVDLLVGTGPCTSLLDLTKFVTDVADLLGLPEDRVDVFEDDALRPGSNRGARIAAEMQPLGPWAAG